ncbi:MAG TPA: glycosyltransferase [Gammaproteobacteria bacterium]|nr:glycosyltransferase [Gammaproteobacteria bacterium]
MSDSRPDSDETVSLVIPLYNEAENIEALLKRVHEGLASLPYPWEVILVDDGSSDDTLAALNRLAGVCPGYVRIVSLQRNYGQTAAMQAGIDAARGSLIATLDGDLQNDPADIPKMIEELSRRNLDLLQGWRVNRQDKLLLRKIPSRIANWLIGKVTGLKLHDYGCSLKVYRASILHQIRLYGEMHRFIPAWVAAVTPPNRIGEMPVSHHARLHGDSKYGIGRTTRVIIDLLTVLFFLRFRARPGHFFGSIGLIMGALSSLILGWLAIVKFALGEDIGSRPLFLVGVLLAIASIQFLTTGVLAEILVRTYHESSRQTPFRVHEGQRNRDPEWHIPGESPDRC